MRLPISGLIMICFAAVLFFLFIVFNFAFMGEGGLKETMWDSANATLEGKQLTRWNQLMPQITQGFGIAGVLCFIMAIVFFVVDIYHDPGGSVRF